MSHAGRIQNQRDADMRQMVYDTVTAYAKVTGKGNFIKSAGNGSGTIYRDPPSLPAPMPDDATAQQLAIDPQKHIVLKPSSGAYQADYLMHAEEISSMLSAFRIKHIITNNGSKNKTDSGFNEVIVDITQGGLAENLKKMAVTTALEAEIILSSVAPARGKPVITKS